MIGPVKGRIAAALAALAWIAAPGTAQAQFTVEGTYATAGGPYSSYAGDFNRDGRQDIAVSNGDAGSVSLFLRQPGGGFAEEPGSPFALTGATSNGAIGDFNGDGYPDLAIADFVFGSGVVVALRNPAGGFTPESPPSLGGQLSAVGAGDFNLDGRVDLAVATYNAANVTILLRNPSNTGFTVSTNHAVGVQPRQIAVADFDANGQADIAVTNFVSNTVSVLLNSGGAAFSAEPPVAVGVQPNGIAAGDYDGDGRTDLAVANTGGDTVSVLLRSPLGGFTVAAPVAVGDEPATVATADFDADGTLDIAVTTRESLDVIRRGAAGFARDTTTPIPASGSGLALADFNADGRTDAATSSYGGNLLTVLLGPSPPAPPPPPQPTPTPTPPAPTLENPQVNREVNVLPVSGTVLIKRRGSNRYVALKAGEQIPNGSSIDARKGRVTIVAAQSGTKVERADFFDGLFTVSQTRRVTTLTLTEQLDCSRRASAAQKRKPKSRKLWGDGKGKFRTKGRYAAATVRGTRWLTRDTCTTTKVTVRVGAVSVRDAVRKRTIVVRKGKSYTARARR